jgi:hypothetical protein
LIGFKLKEIIRRISASDLIYFEEQFMYGHREVLLHYCGQKRDDLSNTSILQGSIDHGFAYQENIWRLRNRNLTRAKRYVWNHRHKVAYGADDLVVTTGSPWLYLLSALGITPENMPHKLKKEPKKVVVFPGHNVGTYFKYDLQKLGQHFLPFIPKDSKVTVCLFWTDFCDPVIRKSFTDLGWAVESMGYVPRLPSPDSTQGGRQNFLLELFSLLSTAELFLTDNASSGLFYAMSLNLEIMYIPSLELQNYESVGNSLIGLDNNRLAGFFSSEKLWVEHYLPSLFDTKNKPSRYVNFSWNELGYEYFLTNESGYKFDWINSGADPRALDLYNIRFKEVKNSLSP